VVERRPQGVFVGYEGAIMCGVYGRGSRLEYEANGEA
jgi:hypothetical protein